MEGKFAEILGFFGGRLSILLIISTIFGFVEDRCDLFGETHA